MSSSIYFNAPVISDGSTTLSRRIPLIPFPALLGLHYGYQRRDVIVVMAAAEL
jgi:hypothetical protein